MTHPTRFEDIRTLLLPRLSKPGSDPSRTAVPGHLDITVVLAMADRDVTVDQALLDEWGVDLDTALDAAWANLRGLSSATRWQAVATVPGMHIYLPGSGDAASRGLLLTELVERWPMEGVLFAVPTPDQLMIVPLDRFQDLPTIRILVTAARFATDVADHPLSDQIFWHDGTSISVIPVEHEDDNVDILPPPEFLAVVERMASMSLIAAAAEA